MFRDNGTAQNWAFGNYAANFLVFAAPQQFTTEGITTFASVTDGASYTLFFAERLRHLRQQRRPQLRDDLRQPLVGLQCGLAANLLHERPPAAGHAL